jgi:hypothetical protein
MPFVDIRTNLYLPADITNEALNSGLCTTIYHYYPTGYSVVFHGKPLMNIGDVDKDYHSYSVRYSVWWVDQDAIKVFYNSDFTAPTQFDNQLARELMVIPTTEARLIYLRDYYERNPD